MYIEERRKLQAGVPVLVIKQECVVAGSNVMNRPPGALVVKKYGNRWYTVIGGTKYDIPNQGWDDTHGSVVALIGKPPLIDPRLELDE